MRALEAALANTASFSLINVHLDPYDRSPALDRLAQRLSKIVTLVWQLAPTPTSVDEVVPKTLALSAGVGIDALSRCRSSAPCGSRCSLLSVESAAIEDLAAQGVDAAGPALCSGRGWSGRSRRSCRVVERVDPLAEARRGQVLLRGPPTAGSAGS